MDKKRPFASPDAMAEFKVALFRNAVRRETLADGDAAFAEEVGRHFGALAKRLAEENGSGE